VEDGTAEHPFRTIQQAIDAAGLRGIVKVARGVYQESLLIHGKRLEVKGGYVGGTYPGTGDFSDATRDPDPATNHTEFDGAGSATQVTCQNVAARGSTLDGLTFRNGGAIFRGGLVLKRVIARH
jgi:pectin methylesterase-like acyl-CoA thioesterase